MHRIVLALTTVCSLAFSAPAAALEPIPRRLPPAGIEIPAETIGELARRLAVVSADLERWKRTATAFEGLTPDVAIYLKAVRYALDHGEFWEPVEADWAGRLLDVAAERLAALRAGRTPWRDASGLVFRGYRSALDGSLQPYGVQIPHDLDPQRPAPLYVYLHGRREKMVELQFLEQGHEVGRIEAPGTVVLHAFGRYCNGYKAAGEIDIREAIAHVRTQYPVDPDRIVIAGFSMGGAGVWHLAAHYPDLWVAASPGAGFAETAEYNRLQPADYPPAIEQLLWGLYDVPAYVRNLFQMDVIAYTGENDRQIQAADIMARAYRENRRTLTHIVGPGTGHKYHPDSRREILKRLGAAVGRGMNRSPETVTLQTRTLRYDRCRWVRIVELERHWHDSRVDARQRPGRIELETRNVAALEVAARDGLQLAGAEVAINGTTRMQLPDEAARKVTLRQSNGRWHVESSPPPGLRKVHGLQGPIDDAFQEPFLVVTPTGTAAHPNVESWVAFELERFLERWRRLFRGEPRVKKDVDVTAEDQARFHLILWGDPRSNRLLKDVLNALPVAWDARELQIGEHSYDATHHVPVLIYPNPQAPSRYVVLNSGMTFRESHDRTNSLQNPKLGDWAILDLRQPPDGSSAGRIVRSDVFDEGWQLR